MDMERMQRVIRHLTNEIIDLKKNKGEGKKPFNPFIKKRTYFSPKIPPTSYINIENYAIDNCCCTHHANHSQRICPKFINYFIAIISSPESPKREKRNEEEDEELEEEGEELPFHLNLIWNEEEFRYDDDDDIMEEAWIGNDYNLRSKEDPKRNDSPSTSKTNNKSSTSKQTSTDKSPEKENEKEK